ncbi:MULTISPECIES: NAD(P)-dependent oxidoreductase [unclassified Pseudomonas]|uniref:NAD(P)-dependent oxidoreductase n=1 Tax=unclassified Pseudomonas TaxID=196821 RepID=UPI00244C7DA4|nr:MULTISPECIES: NAD(P)-dependent oxidoreductase [unclassified Pseudomonas]MDG9929541.1 NAD(P)-dependent oxidoreductase [Pseudomonas sp. GD04042]MDH0483581.1 NAD(P)-dependent oxidoreductase [Pseudomonas sp. GD04015]MDH0606535.1 NAD(P)-dependent oxidoreductase [Pseudomonas sp. GD03869]
MKLALIGATGYVGSALLEEALNRGHQVTALVRHPEKLPQHANLVAVQADVHDVAALANHLRDHDAVLSAFNPGWGVADIREQFIAGSRAIVAATKAAGLKRLLVVGGAGSLYVAPGKQLIDSEGFPVEYKEGAEGARQALDQLREERELEWTFLSPAAHLEPGPRTGQFRLGGDELLLKDGQPGHISVADLAVALLDETEQPRHVRQRFTLAY